MLNYLRFNSPSFKVIKFRRFLCVEVLLLTIIVLLHAYPFITLGVDIHNQRCLENIKVAALMHFKPSAIKILRGDLIYWRPSGPLGYVRDEYVVKRVAGVAGDFLSINGDDVKINNQVVATGLPNGTFEGVRAHLYDKSEIIPKDCFFVLGDNPLSYDSRYWGYVSYDSIMGRAIALF